MTGRNATVAGFLANSRLVGKKRGLLALAVLVVAVLVVSVESFRADARDTVGGGKAGGDGFCVEMPDTVGLYPGNPVTQMGYKVGQVSAVKNEYDHVRIEFSLDPGRAYPAAVRAVTRSKSLLADRSLELVGNYRGGPTLAAGKCIPVANAYTPKSISEVSGSASDFLKALSDGGTDDVRLTVDGLDRALAGTGESANSMFRHAAGAARNPDRFIAEIGSAISDMAPLTTDALQSWPQIQSILEKMPSTVDLAADLFPNVNRFMDGVAKLVSLAYEIQTKHGDLLWPLVHGPVTDLIAEGANRVPDLTKIADMLPAVGTALESWTGSGGLSATVVAAPMKISGEQCRALGAMCDSRSGKASTVNPLSLLIQKAGVQ